MLPDCAAGFSGCKAGPSADAACGQEWSQDWSAPGTSKMLAASWRQQQLALAVQIHDARHDTSAPTHLSVTLPVSVRLLLLDCTYNQLGSPPHGCTCSAASSIACVQICRPLYSWGTGLTALSGNGKLLLLLLAPAGVVLSSRLEPPSV